MKSKLIQNADYLSNEDKNNYSDLQVLLSNAGYYIGTMYSDEDGWLEPGSRDSRGYWDSMETAEWVLSQIHSNKDLYSSYLREVMDD